MERKIELLILRLNEQEYAQMFYALEEFTVYLNKLIRFEFNYLHNEDYFEPTPNQVDSSIDNIRNELEFIHHVSEKYDCGVEIDPEEMDDFQIRKFIADFVHNSYCQILEDYQKRCSNSEEDAKRSK